MLNVVNQQLQNGDFGKILVVSFENSLSAAQERLNSFHLNAGLEFALFKRPAFIGAFSLDNCIEAACNEIFKVFPHKIVARGPIAGYIALKALCKVNDERQLLQNPEELPKLTIQARGLLAKEHELCTKNSSFNPFTILANWFVGQQKLALEKAVYGELGLSKLAFKIEIETVTQYLADYLSEEFGASQQRMVLAKNDLVPALSAAKIAQYRTASRNKFGLTESTLVYCYSGSAKPWQGVTETIDLFWELFENNPTIFFLVLSQEPEVFENLLRAKHLPDGHYAVINADSQEEYYKLMCAADIGVILRADHIVNWVSRPTKVLDYLACGLKLKHNHTVGWVIELSDQLAAQEAKTKAKVAVEAAPAKVTAAKRDTSVMLKKAVAKPEKTVAKSKAAAAKTTAKKAAAPAKGKAASAKTASSKTAAGKGKTVAKPGKKPAVKTVANKKRPKSQANL